MGVNSPGVFWNNVFIRISYKGRGVLSYGFEQDSGVYGSRSSQAGALKRSLPGVRD